MLTALPNPPRQYATVPSMQSEYRHESPHVLGAPRVLITGLGSGGSDPRTSGAPKTPQVLTAQRNYPQPVFTRHFENRSHNRPLEQSSVNAVAKSSLTLGTTEVGPGRLGSCGLAALIAYSKAHVVQMCCPHARENTAAPRMLQPSGSTDRCPEIQSNP